MKAAVLYEPNTPLVIEEVGLRKPAAHEVLLRTAVAGLCHSDLHFIEGLYPHPLPVVLGHEFGRDRRAGRLGGELREARRPRGDLPLGVLRHLRELHHRPAGAVHQHRGQAAAGQGDPPAMGPARAAAHLRQPVLVRRADAGPRERGGEDPRRHAARPRGADRLRRHHRLRRGGQYRQGGPRRDRGGDRLRRRRHGRDQRRLHRRRGADHRRSTPTR